MKSVLKWTKDEDVYEWDMKTDSEIASSSSSSSDSSEDGKIKNNKINWKKYDSPPHHTNLLENSKSEQICTDFEKDEKIINVPSEFNVIQ